MTNERAEIKKAIKNSYKWMIENTELYRCAKSERRKKECLLEMEWHLQELNRYRNMLNTAK